MNETLIFHISSQKSVSFNFEEQPNSPSGDRKLAQLIKEHGLPASLPKNFEANLLDNGYKASALVVGQMKEGDKVARAASSTSTSTRGYCLEEAFKEQLKSPSNKEVIRLVREHPALIYKLIKKDPDLLKSCSKDTSLEIHTLLSEIGIKKVNEEQKSLKEILSEGGITNQTPEFLLKIAHHFTYIDLRDIESINPVFGSAEFLEKFIENCPNLTHLFIKSDEIKKLPAELPSCIYFNCSSCRQLGAIPTELPSCTHFNCSSCRQLGAIPTELPSCTHFNCNYCSQLTAIPAELPNCILFNCNNCSHLASIPAELRNCILFNCNNCSQLAAIPAELPNCTRFGCNNCDQLTSIPAELSNCTHFDCSCCGNLTAIPAELSNCTNFDCSFCSQLAAIPAELPSCTRFECNNCDQLAAIPAELLNCTHFECNNCSQLAAIPAALLNCRHFECNCLQIRGIPELPRDAVVYSPLNSTKLDIPFEDLNKHPEKILDALTGWFFRNFHFPTIQFIEDGKASSGVDIGGLRRHLVSTLFHNLISQPQMTSVAAAASSTAQDESKTVQKSSVGENYPLPLFSLTHPSGICPLQPITNDQIKARWNTVGRLFGFAYRDSLIIGRHFHPRLFSALFTYLNPAPSTAEKTQEQQNRDSYLNIFYQLFGYDFARKALAGEKLIDNEKGRYDYLLDRLQEVNPDFDSKKASKDEISVLLKDAINSGCLGGKEMPYPEIIAAVESIAAGMKSIPGLTLPKSAEELQAKIEGKLSTKLVEDSLQWENLSEESASRKLLSQWIKGASEEQLTKFVKAISGSTTLIPQFTKLNIVHTANNERGIPIAHTCLYSLELPAYQAGDKEQFNKNMDTFLDHALFGTGFSLA